jgi:hypothetical protein
VADETSRLKAADRKQVPSDEPKRERREHREPGMDGRPRRSTGKILRQALAADVEPSFDKLAADLQKLAKSSGQQTIPFNEYLIAPHSDPRIIRSESVMLRNEICICGHPLSSHRTYGCTALRPNPDPKKSGPVYCHCKRFEVQKAARAS